MTMLHEMIHWQDARKYVAEFGEITNQREHLEYIIAKHKRNVDELGKNGYNIRKVSDYAFEIAFKFRYDEVMTEYRVMRLLR